METPPERINRPEFETIFEKGASWSYESVTGLEQSNPKRLFLHIRKQHQLVKINIDRAPPITLLSW